MAATQCIGSSSIDPFSSIDLGISVAQEMRKLNNDDFLLLVLPTIPDMTDADIAALLGVSRRTVCNRRNSLTQRLRTALTSS